MTTRGQNPRGEAARWERVIRRASSTFLAFLSISLFTLALPPLVHSAAQTRDPDTTLARDLFKKGLTHFKQEQYDKAADEFRKARVLKPDFFEAHLRLAQALFLQKKFAAAETSFKEALSIKPDDETTTAGLIITHVYQHRYNEAEQLIEVTLRRNKDSEVLHTARGFLEFERGNIGEAKKAFQRVIEINPQNNGAKQALLDIERAEQEKLRQTPKSPVAARPSRGDGILKWIAGLLAYLVGAVFAQFVIGLLQGLINIVGLGAVTLPGAGMDWLAKKLGVAASEKTEKWNLGFYIATWAGPLYLVTQLALITTQAIAIGIFTGVMITWFPANAGAFRILGWLWILGTIGFSGAIAYAIILWLLKLWLGTLGILWSLFGQV